MAPTPADGAAGRGVEGEAVEAATRVGVARRAGGIGESKTVQDKPKTPQECPKTAQECPQAAKDLP